MPVTATPIFVQAGKIGSVTISTANTARDGTGTIADLVPTSTNGTRVDRIEWVATGTTTPGMLRFFIHDGTSWRLWRERRINTGVTPSGTTAATSGEMVLDNRSTSDGSFILPATHKLGVATHNAEEFEVHAIGGLL